MRTNWCDKLEFIVVTFGRGFASLVPNGAGSVKGGGFCGAKLGGIVIKIQVMTQKQPLSHLTVTAPLTQGSLSHYHNI